MRPLLLACVLLALAAPSASAQVQLDVNVRPGETRYGDRTRVTGTVTQDGLPLAGATVRLEGRRYPFVGSMRTLATTVSDEAGRYTFSRRLDRNWDLRAVARDAVTGTVRAYVFPDFRLRFNARGERRIRITQTYRVPRPVVLERPTLFYVGPRDARTAPVRARGKVRRIAPGRYRSTALVRLPRRWNGRFRYASCFRYTAGSGMGNPRASCPRRFRF